MYSYNNSAPLLRAFGQAYPNIVLCVVEGHIYAGKRHGYIARCDDNQQATEILADSGYIPDSLGRENQHYKFSTVPTYVS